MVKQIERHSLEELECERNAALVRRRAPLDATIASSASNYWRLFGFLTEGWLRTTTERPLMTQEDTPIEPRRFQQVARTVS